MATATSTAPITIPAGTPAGPHTIRAATRGSTAVAEVVVQVAPAGGGSQASHDDGWRCWTERRVAPTTRSRRRRPTTRSCSSVPASRAGSGHQPRQSHRPAARHGTGATRRQHLRTDAKPDGEPGRTACGRGLARRDDRRADEHHLRAANRYPLRLSARARRLPASRSCTFVARSRVRRPVHSLTRHTNCVAGGRAPAPDSRDLEIRVENRSSEMT